MMVDIEDGVAHRVAAERRARGWPLAELAQRSGVSSSMLSKIERGEASPTATVLLKIASALGVTLAGLLTPPDEEGGRKLSRADQPTWVDPACGYLRRQVYLSRAMPLELVEVELPTSASVAAPASSYELVRQVLWVMEGKLDVTEGAETTQLYAGDRIEFGAPSDVVFHNPGKSACRYLVAVLRT